MFIKNSNDIRSFEIISYFLSFVNTLLLTYDINKNFPCKDRTGYLYDLDIHLKLLEKLDRDKLKFVHAIFFKGLKRMIITSLMPIADFLISIHFSMQPTGTIWWVSAKLSSKTMNKSYLPCLMYF